MKHKPMITLAFCAMLSAPLAQGDTIVQWVDENGVTQFGDAQFAPAGRGESVHVNPANAMDTVDTQILSRTESRRVVQPRVLKRTVRENPRGFRGFNGRPTQGRNGARRY